MSIASVKAENRAKLLMIVNAAGAAVTSKEVFENPACAGLSQHQVGHYLGALAKAKQIRRLAGRKYAPLKNKTVVSDNVETKMYFVINAEARTIQLDIGGLRLPVKVE